MATNPFFNWYPESVTNEQLLVEDLAIEALQINGMEVYYIPRASAGIIDKLYGEDQLKKFSAAYKLEMYLENVTGMDGEGDFLSKFGLEIRDELSLLVARRRFRYTVPNQVRPNEGDLIYIPLLQNFFEIIFVEHENNQAAFYSLGRGRASNVVFYALKLRQFVFNEERVDTGVSEIDDQMLESYRPLLLTLTAGGTGNYDSGNTEYVYQGANLALATAYAEVLNWTNSTRKLNVIRVHGQFAAGTILKGNTSNAQWNVSTTDSDTPLDTMFEDAIDNKIIQTEANTILDFSASNPFGNPGTVT